MLSTCVSTQVIGGVAARIHCADRVFDFGRRMDTASLECVFVIENRGELTLEIDAIRSSCGCTVASMSSKTIRPGDRAELRVDVDLTGRRGEFDKQIRIESNDPDMPAYRLVIRGEVVPSRLINPRHVFFRSLGKQESAVESVDVKFNAEPKRIGRVESHADFLRADLEEIEQGRSYRISVRAAPPYPQGELKGEVYVYDDDGDLVFTIPVWLQVVADIMHSPQTILIYDDGSGSVRRQIVIRRGSVSEFSILEVQVPDERIETSVHTLGDYGYRIQLDNIPVEAELNNEVIVVLTDAGGSAKIEIPLEIRDKP